MTLEVGVAGVAAGALAAQQHAVGVRSDGGVRADGPGVAADHFAALLWMGTADLLTLLVLNEVGPEASAYYFMANTIGFDIIGTLEPQTLPDGPTSGSFRDASFATALVPLDQSTTVGETPFQTFIMSSGLKGVSFEITGRYKTVVTDPLGPIVKPVRRPPRGIGF